MTTLRIADGLTLPLEAASETFLIVGKRGRWRRAASI